MEDDKNQMTMSCDMGMKMKVVESNRKAQKSKYISISYEIILRTPCMVYTMKQLPQIIGTSSSTCMLCLQVNLQSLIRKRFLYLSVRWNNVEPTPTIKKSQWRISNLEILLRLYYCLPSHQTPRIPYSCCCSSSCCCSVTKSVKWRYLGNQAWYHRSAGVKTTGKNSE